MRLMMRDVQHRVAAHYGAEIDTLRMRDSIGAREASICKPRHVAMYLCRSLVRDSASGRPISLGRIGHQFNRDHTTVIHAIRKIEQQVMRDEVLRSEVAAIETAILSTDEADLPDLATSDKIFENA